MVMGLVTSTGPERIVGAMHAKHISARDRRAISICVLELILNEDKITFEHFSLCFPTCDSLGAGSVFYSQRQVFDTIIGLDSALKIRDSTSISVGKDT
jgi:hypothetical protein